jgi:hypothetical protein
MPPLFALVAWFILLVLLFRYDPAREKKESWGRWAPLIWVFFFG